MNSRIRFMLPLLVLVVAGSGLTLGDESPALSNADASFFAIDYPAAIGAYDVLLRDHPGNPHILWRLARAHVCLAEVQDDAQRKTMCEIAEGYARRCVAADPAVAEGHTWLAAALGYIALASGDRRATGMSIFSTGGNLGIAMGPLLITPLVLFWSLSAAAAARAAARPCMAKTYMLSAEGMAPSSVAMSSPRRPGRTKRTPRHQRGRESRSCRPPRLCFQLERPCFDCRQSPT